jgi:uncharacterized protein (DUF608 family)
MKKQLKTWLVANIKDGKFRILSYKFNLKQIKSKLKPMEIPIDLTMNVEVPETPILKAHGEIKLSQSEISDIVLSEMIEEDDEGQTKL